MQQERKTLSIKRPAAAATEGAASDPTEILRRAIRLKLCATAVYNKVVFRFAPHILYTRHDEPFVDAMVIERDGKPPREAKLGVFKLSGLNDLQITTIPFLPLALFDPAEEKYAGTTLQAIRI